MDMVKRHGSLDGQALLFVENVAQQAAVDPLDDHVAAAALFAVVGFHHAGVVDLLADLLLAAEAFKQNRIGFHLRMRHLDGHGAAAAQVLGAVRAWTCRCGQPPLPGGSDPGFLRLRARSSLLSASQF